MIMSEQQKIDDTIDTVKSLNEKKLSKFEQSSTSLENQQNSASEVGSEDNDDASSILETPDDEMEESVIKLILQLDFLIKVSEWTAFKML